LSSLALRLCSLEMLQPQAQNENVTFKRVLTDHPGLRIAISLPVSPFGRFVTKHDLFEVRYCTKGTNDASAINSLHDAVAVTDMEL